jgi:manganese efflux pump family protein
VSPSWADCEHGRVLKLLAFVLPLGLDSFAIAAALGTRRASAAQRWRVSALFVGFEAAMPLVGLAAGVPVARLAGTLAEYIAAAALIAVGIWMIFSGDSDEDAAARMLATRGLAAVVLGLSISLDELAIGFTLGLAHLPVVPVIIAIAVQALIASQAGLALGSRIGEKWRERAERLAGIMLAVLGLVLIARRLLG